MLCNCIMGINLEIMCFKHTRKPTTSALYDEIHHVTPAAVAIKTVSEYITNTCLYNFDPLKPPFYIVKLGFIGVYIIFCYSSSKT